MNPTRITIWGDDDPFGYPRGFGLCRFFFPFFSRGGEGGWGSSEVCGGGRVGLSDIQLLLVSLSFSSFSSFSFILFLLRLGWFGFARAVDRVLIFLFSS